MKPGVFCLEGEWGATMHDRSTVEPTLRLLEGLGCAQVIHRDVGTREELAFYARRWTQKQYSAFTVAYLAFHGVRGQLCIGSTYVTLDELGELLAGRCAGRVIYMGSCSTLATSDQALKHFVKQTKAKAVVGYTRNVSWLEAAAFDVLLLSQLLESQQMKPVYTRLSQTYPDLTGRLGFRMAAGTWASDRRPAVEAMRGTAKLSELN